jgi:protein tyrosine/serine phosphatase
VAKGLIFMAQNEAPYLIHCTEGKDRAGFTAMLLGALMGAELREIVDDYMLSFYNYYGIDKEKEHERYETVLNTNLFTMLYHVTGADTVEKLAQTDLQAAVTDYLLQHGMNESDISALQDKLR